MNFMANGIIQFEENVKCDSLFMRRSLCILCDSFTDSKSSIGQSYFFTNESMA
jgi:hypothetical protein